jgi:homoserine kinase
MLVVAPASSANLGSGFDAVGLALNLPFTVANEPVDGLLVADEHHPVTVAYRSVGGTGALWWRSPIAPGRGLGFSGAARVAGAFLAALEAGETERAARETAFEAASVLEGHPDNAAASAYGGFVVAAGGHVVSVPVPDGIEVVVWWPDSETSTSKSRASLPSTVPFEDAAFNVGRVALLVAAFASGDLSALAAGVEDRLHQPSRLARVPDSEAALRALQSAGALAVWLGGSGPTVAALVRSGETEPLLTALPQAGHHRVLEIDRSGVRCVER